jgi:hypothetical protein
MVQAQPVGIRLDRPVGPGRDHILGPVDAPVTLVEYGGYACPHCRAANDRIAEVRNQCKASGTRMRRIAPFMNGIYPGAPSKVRSIRSHRQ